MRLENSFEVAAPPDAAWRLLTDVPAVLPCLPGAELVEVVSESSWKAKLHVKLGPISLQFLADLDRSDVDEAARSVVLTTKAREAKGRGTAAARIVSSISPAGGGTRVDLVTELELRGAVAQYGRGVVAEVASTLTQEFAGCLQGKLSRDHSDPPSAEVHDSPPRINGLALFARAARRALLSRLRAGRRASS